MRHRLLALDDIERGELRQVSVEGISVVVARTPDGRVHVLRNRCSHQGAPLSAGTLEQLVVGYSAGHYALSDSAYVLHCPWHGYEFDVETGLCVADPEHARVRCYEVTVDEGVIYLER